MLVVAHAHDQVLHKLQLLRLLPAVKVGETRLLLLLIVGGDESGGGIFALGGRRCRGDGH